MGKILIISLILVTMVLSLYSLSSADQEAKGISPTNSSNELIYGQSILDRKGEALFSSPKKAGPGRTPNGILLGKAIRNPEVPMNPEITNAKHYLVSAEIQFHSENSQSSKRKSGYHFGKINLTKNNLDPSLDFISRLSVTQLKEEDPSSWTLEKPKENGLFQSLSILLEFKLNF
jgi:hypothetical protein